jgi:hypothetical protein
MFHSVVYYDILHYDVLSLCTATAYTSSYPFHSDNLEISREKSKSLTLPGEDTSIWAISPTKRSQPRSNKHQLPASHGVPYASKHNVETTHQGKQ